MSPLSRDPEELKIPAFMRKREIGSRAKQKLQMTAFDRKEAGYLPEGVTKKTAKTSGLYDGEKEAPATRANKSAGAAWSKQNLYGRGTVTPESSRLPTMQEHATTRRPGNMWEIAIAAIHKEKHPEARVVPRLKPRAPRPPRQPREQREPPSPMWQSPELFDEQQYQNQHAPEPRIEPRAERMTERMQADTARTERNPYYQPDRPTRMRHDLQHAPTQQGPTTQTLKAVGEVTEFFAKINVAVLRLYEELSVGDSITYQTPDGSHTQTVLSMEIDRKPIFKAVPGNEIGIKLYKAALVGKVVYGQAQAS